MMWKTPHRHEYLLLATKAAWRRRALAAWFVLMMARERGRQSGRPALLLWLTVAVTALANATLRDTKLAIPLLLLAGLTGALHREARVP